MAKYSRLTLLNWDDEYIKDFEEGIGFDIDDPEGIDKNNNRSDRGIYSNLYGGETSADDEISDRYSCKCKNLKGKFYLGTVCPICNTEVQFSNNELKKTGWITLRSELKLINPLYYFILEKVIGKKNLNAIIYYSAVRDKDGQVIINEDYYDENNPFFNIGIMEFYNRFDEIIEYYKNNSKNNLKSDKDELIKFILENRENIFVNHIPVFSLLLRPILLVKQNMIYDKINTKFQTLVVNITKLNKNETDNDRSDIRVLPLLYQSQVVLNEVHKKVVETNVSGKEGQIRSNLLGERVNYSARCVIIPLIGRYAIDEIKLSYIVFLELYKNELINLMMKLDNLSIKEANNRWHQAVEKFDRRMYLLMKHLIEETKGGLYCILNRNPSLNYGSLLCMKVVEVDDDFENTTLWVPLNVLGLLSGDFDGDVLNLISIKTGEFRDYYNSMFNPKLMMIDRNDGTFNRKMNLIKDQMIGLYSFCESD